MSRGRRMLRQADLYAIDFERSRFRATTQIPPDIAAGDDVTDRVRSWPPEIARTHLRRGTIVVEPPSLHEVLGRQEADAALAGAATVEEVDPGLSAIPEAWDADDEAEAEAEGTESTRPVATGGRKTKARKG